MAIAQKLLHEGFSAYVANTTAFVFAFGLSYLGHFYISFDGVARHASAFGRFVIIAIGGFLLNNAILLATLEGLALPPSLALGTAILTVPIAVYLASHFWGFRAA